MLPHILALIALLAASGELPATTGASDRRPVLTGTVLGAETGEPIPGAVVEIHSYRDPETARERRAARDILGDPIARGATDAEGRFRVAAPPSTHVIVVAGATGRARARYRRPLMTPAGSEPRDLGRIELAVGRRLTGRIVDAAGRPVAGAIVAVAAPRGARGGPPPGGGFARTMMTGAPAASFPVVTSTADDGTFVCDGVPLRPVTVRAWADDLAPGLAENVRMSTGVTLRLEKGHSFRGKVVAPDGKTAVAGAWVLAGEDGWDGITRSRPDGAFELTHLRPGPTSLSAVMPDGATGPMASWAPAAPLKAAIPPAPGAPGFTLRLRPGGVVRAKAVDAATLEPVAGAVLSLEVAGETKPRLSVAGADGRSAFSGVPAGGVGLRAEADGYLEEEIDSRPLAAGQARDLSAALRMAASIEGTVRDAAGRPIAGAEVTVSGPPPFAGGLPVPLFFPIGVDPVKSDAQGRFRLAGLPPGEALKIAVALAGYAPWDTAGLKLRPGERRDGLEILLDAGLLVTGRLVDQEGSPVEGAGIVASRRREGSPGGGIVIAIGGRGRRGTGRGGPLGSDELPETVSDAEGIFRVRGAAPGVWSIAIKARGFAPRTLAGLKIDAPDDMLDAGDIVLEPGARLGGLVAGPSGEPIPYASGRVTRQFATLSEFTSGPDGSWTIDDLAPGEAVTLVVDAEGYATVEKGGLVPPSESIVVTLAPSSRLSGQVIDEETRRPIPDFAIAMSRSRSAGGGGMMINMSMAGPRTAFHAEDGTFTIEDVDPGRVAVTAGAPGYRESAPRDVVVPEGQDVEGLVLMLSRAASVSGTVLDDHGRPLPNVGVGRKETAAGPGMRLRAGGDASTTTDGDGTFLMDGLERAPMTLAFTHPEFEPAERDVDLSARDAQGLRITLSRGSSIVGTVVRDPEGSPVAGATVTATAAGSDRFGETRSSTTGPDGSFVIDAVAQGRYRLRAEAPGRGAGEVGDVVVTAEVSPPPIEIRLAGGVTLTGSVLGVKADQLPRFTVRAVGPGGGFGSSAPVDATGRFEIGGLAPGTLTLVAGSGIFGGRSTTRTIRIPEGVSTFETTIEFPGGNRVEGIVTRGGRPVDGASVMFVASGTRTSTTATTDTAGRFVVDDLEGGDYDVSVLQFTTGLSHTTKRTVNGDEDILIELPLARLAGLVRDAASGQPLDGATVAIRPSGDAAPGTAFIFRRESRSDATGYYEFEGLDDGNYTLTASRQGYGFETRVVTIVPSVEPGELSFDLDPVDAYTFRAVDAASGLPLRSLSVLVLAGGGDIAFQGRLSADASGLFRIDTLQPGVYRIVIGGQGLGTSTRHDVAVPGPESTVTLRPGGSLEISAEGLPPGDTVRCVLLDPQGRPAHVDTRATDPAFNVRPDSPLTLPGLDPGSYRLRADLPGGGRIEKDVSVAPGATATVSLP